MRSVGANKHDDQLRLGSSAQEQVVYAMRSGAVWAPVIHTLALLVAGAMFAFYLVQLLPIITDFLIEGSWSAVTYLIVASLVIPVYWPSAAYRLLILAGTPFVKQLPIVEFPLVRNAELPPVTIIVAVRNEPKDLVIPLLDSLMALDYPNYEVVIADNSDLLDETGSNNQDFLAIHTFVQANRDRLRMVRRARGKAQLRLGESLLGSTQNLLTVGEQSGGKAGNINAALASCDPKYAWALILDSDSSLQSSSLREMVALAVQATKKGEHVGFVQSTLTSTNPGGSRISQAQSVLDDLYYKRYFRLKSVAGLVPNLGHGVLISLGAWRQTNGIPLEISEDLAWANELLLLGGFQNYYTFTETGEAKPSTWTAFRVQRHRWAKGTTIQLRKQIQSVWASKRIRWHEKMDLTYDMSSYLLSAGGCVLPLVFLFSGVLGPAREFFFATLLPAFYIVMLMDNLLVPIEAGWLFLRGQRDSAIRVAESIPWISIFYGGIAAEVCKAVVVGLWARESKFAVTPKMKSESLTFLARVRGSEFGLVLGAVNGWITIEAMNVNPWIVPLLVLSPISYFLAPLLGSRESSRAGEPRCASLSANVPQDAI